MPDLQSPLVMRPSRLKRMLHGSSLCRLFVGSPNLGGGELLKPLSPSGFESPGVVSAAAAPLEDSDF